MYTNFWLWSLRNTSLFGYHKKDTVDGTDTDFLGPWDSQKDWVKQDMMKHHV